MKRVRIALLTAIMAISGTISANAQSLGDLFGGNLGQTVGNLLEGVFSSSNITIADLQGTWTSDGPAVCFQGEGFLKKAGGAAAASALETKLSPYYDKLGLSGAVLTVDDQTNFTLKCKSMTLRGTITQKEGATPGVFEFNFNVLGKKVVGVTTYIQKTSQTMDVMFDVTKLKNLISTVSAALNISTLNTISKLLDSYDGLCAGFHMTGSDLPESGNSGLGTLGNILGFGSKNSSSSSTDSNADSDSGSNTTTGTNTSTNTTTTGESKVGDAVKTGLELLKGKLKK